MLYFDAKNMLPLRPWHASFFLTLPLIYCSMALLSPSILIFFQYGNALAFANQFSSKACCMVSFNKHLWASTMSTRPGTETSYQYWNAMFM